jgi:Putative DnaT-like ssDNA binding protein
MQFDEAVIDIFDLEQQTDYLLVTSAAHYGTVGNADSYFAYHLSAEPWTDASQTDKRKALVQASRLIDRLSFFGTKFEEDQELEFPRGTAVVPKEINYACYEIALMLLDGVDMEIEIVNLTATGQGFSSARTTYDRSFVLEHLRAGIPSALAWSYLKPYLNSSNSLILSRAT